MNALLIEVDSTAIRAVGYDGHTLTVEFHNGRTYPHPKVPFDVYQGLMQADSKGQLLQPLHPGEVPLSRRRNTGDLTQ